MTFKDKWPHWRWLAASVLLLCGLSLLGSAYLHFARQSCQPLCQTPTLSLPWWGTVDVSLLFFYILITAAVIFIVVEVFLFWATLRGPTAPPPPTLANVVNTPRDVVWTALPGLLLAGLLGFSMYAFAQTQTLPPTTTLEVVAIGHQWWWEFHYPALHLTTNYALVVPRNATVHLAVTSADVAHNLWVPELFGQTDALPGITTTITFRARATADFFSGTCAEVCGPQHTQMYAAVRVLAAEEFAAWVQAQQQVPPSPTTEATIAGQKVFFQAGCAACHYIAGTAAQGHRGPDLSHLQSQTALAGGIVPNTPTDLRAWLVAPADLKPGAGMPNPNLNAAELDALLAYLLTLK